MAIFFDQELDRLKTDLANGGYDVLAVYRFPKVPGRIVQLFLANAVFVNWDRKSARLRIEGPLAQRTSVEEFLRLTYEASWFEKTWAFHRRTLNLVTAAIVLLAGGFVLTAAFHSDRVAVETRAKSALTSAE